MTEKEILEAICNDPKHPNGVSSWGVSAEKLATFLATLVPEKEEKDYCLGKPCDHKPGTTPCALTQKIWEYDTPKSEEKDTDTIYAVMHHATNLTTEPIRVTPPSEEKKCELHPDQKLCPDCNRHFCEHTRSSPTPPDILKALEKVDAQIGGALRALGGDTPDAWEKEFDLHFRAMLNRIHDRPAAFHIKEWLHYKKAEWENTAGIAGYDKGWERGRTTTLEEIERVVEEEAAKYGKNRTEWPVPIALDDFLTRLKEMRTTK